MLYYAAYDMLHIQPRIDSHFMTYQSNNRFAHVASSRLAAAVSQKASVTQLTGHSLTTSSNTTLSKKTSRKRAIKNNKANNFSSDSTAQTDDSMHIAADTTSVIATASVAGRRKAGKSVRLTGAASKKRLRASMNMSDDGEDDYKD